MRRYARRALAALATAAIAGTVLAVTHSAGAETSSPVKMGQTITLITGDKVRLSGADQPDIDLRQDVSKLVSYSTYQRNGDWYVLPSDAAPLVRAGLVDERLFDVTELVNEGYDDAHTDKVPLLVQYADAATAGKARPLAGAPARRTLSKFKLTANDQRKSSAGRFWTDLKGKANLKTRSIAGGVRKVWLNARMKASLEQSVPQVGAPAAWQAGFTGKGVTVAVLDTGYDASHPDLAGRVQASKNFTYTDDVADHNGHGSHVASIAAGSGAASGGKRRGVAPDASLAIGKVLDDDGYGEEDTILAGMQWAVAEAGAKVVNMSLGGPPTDGTDLLSQTVNQLSEQYGALFVVAAGNRGYDEPVESPASADAALAVGSVNKSDKLSDFSARNSRLGDGAAKPEIAAPGENIVAARAAVAFPDSVGDPNYVPLSGTSMATPHVAGAAALLAQEHPDWTGAQLKSALVANAAPLADTTVFSVGAGRLDVARAVTQQVQASPATLNAHLPGDKNDTRELNVTYTNSGAQAVTLHLGLSMADKAGKPAPDGLATLGSAEVTVPEHGTVVVPVRIAGNTGTPGLYGGVLVATAGNSTLRTPITVLQDPKAHHLTVNAVDRNGAAAQISPMIANLDSTDVEFYEPGMSVPEGRYAIAAMVHTPRPGQDDLASDVQYPEIRVAADTTVTLDARWAKPVRLVVDDQPAAQSGIRMTAMGSVASSGHAIYMSAQPSDPKFGEVYVGIAPGVSSDQFRLANVASLERPTLGLSAESPEQFAVQGLWFRPTSATPFVGTTTLSAAEVPVDASGKPATVDVSGKLAVLTYPPASPDGATDSIEVTPTIAALQRAGAKMVAVASDYLYWDGSAPPAIPTMRAYGETGDKFRALAHDGKLTAKITGQDASPYRYTLAYVQRGSIPDSLAYHVSTAQLAAVSTAYHSLTDEWHSVYPTLLDGKERWSTGFSIGVPTPTKRAEYYTPGTWQVALSYRIPDVTTVSLNLHAGTNPSLTWGKAVVGPGLAGPSQDYYGAPWVNRDRDVINVQLPLYTDGLGHTELAYTGGMGEETGSTSLYRDGQFLATLAKAGVGTFTVPASESSYRLTAEAALDSPHWPLSTKVSAEWTFRSATTSDVTPLPLLAVGIDAPVDLRNTVAVGSRQPIRLSVNRQDGVANRPIKVTTAEASYDDGKTWQRVTVNPDGNSWCAAVPHAKAGFASLRIQASDVGGNTVQETIIRAYRVG
jgi:subtilisin family serine protease